MITYTTVDRILSIIVRELGDLPFEEDDIIEWIGEAMEFLKVYPILEERVAILKVKDFKAKIPDNLVFINQIHKIEEGVNVLHCEIPKLKELEDCKGNITFKYENEKWMKVIKGTEYLTPIRKSSISSDSCISPSTESPEYKVIGTSYKELLFSFKEGNIALSYSSFALDEETGYPLIPDQADFISAVTYYIKWKISEAMAWRGREGYPQLMQYSRGEWLRYAKQAKNWSKMPKSLDDWQDLMENQYNMIPDLKQYYKAFREFNKAQRWK